METIYLSRQCSIAYSFHQWFRIKVTTKSLVKCILEKHMIIISLYISKNVTEHTEMTLSLIISSANFNMLRSFVCNCPHRHQYKLDGYLIPVDDH